MPVNNIFHFSHGAENVSCPPLIFIHGAGGTHLHWPPQVRRMPGQRVFALDLPGHGKSGGIGSQSVADYARAVVDFLDAVRFNTAVFVGHSMGSAVALTLALDFPQRVIGLGLVGSGARLRVAPQILENTASEATFPAAVKLVNDFAFGASALPSLKELAARQMAEIRPAVLHGDFLACNEFDVMPRLGEIAVPTLILCGGEDRLTPVKYSEFLRDRIPAARLVVFPGAGHMVMLEQPEAVAQALSDFADSIPYRPGQA
ncbi:MAG: alpha/beta hydrolase [Anaerolineales bacterium]|nr:MAG: alpha/beta hydrolase [Anaerolineales bacterium]